MIFRVAALLAFSNLLCVSFNAQVSGGSLSGTVTDTSQAAIPNVQVTLANVATGVARTVATMTRVSTQHLISCLEAMK